MSEPDAYSTQLLHRVPPPAEVREKLSDAMRDVRLLRHLLKVSEKVDRECRARQGATHAGR